MVMLFRNFLFGAEEDKKKQFFKHIGAGCVLLSPVFFVRKYLDNDIWFLLNSGKYILKHGFTRVEPFTVYEGLDFSFQQWLTDVIYYIVFLFFQETGIYLLVLLESILLIILFKRLCLIVSNHNYGISLLFTLFFSVVVSGLMTSRPQLLSICIFVTELMILEMYVKDNTNNKARILLWLIPLSILEINLHAAMWWGFIAILMPYLLEYNWIHRPIFYTDKYNKKNLYIMLPILLLTGFINPYGSTNFFYVFKANAGRYVSAVSEMRGTQMLSVPFVILLALSFSYVLFFQSTGERIHLRYFYFYLGGVFAICTAYRNLGIFAMLIFVGAAYCFRKYSFYRNSTEWMILYAELFICSLLLGAEFKPNTEFLQIHKEQADIAAQLKKIDKRQGIRLFTDYNEGGYFEYEGFLCGMDARLEIFLKSMNGKKDYYTEYINLITGKEWYKTFFKRKENQFDYYLIKKGGLLNNLFLNDKDYKMIIEGRTYAVYKSGMI